ncbi:MAG: DUF6448 family protein [Candidatus Omnitrophota bacterium]|jgi:hypothetical protein
MKPIPPNTIITAAILLFIGSCLVAPDPVTAHCDTLDGPVIEDARIALEKGNVTPVLKWVKSDAEPEIRAAFDQALIERNSDQGTADMKFFEVLVRLHRAGEGALFSGLKPSGANEPVIAKADKALEIGSDTDLTETMSKHLTNGVNERFEHALQLRGHKDESVEAGRRYVKAYVEYVHYVEGIHDRIAGKGGPHHEEAQERAPETHKE